MFAPLAHARHFASADLVINSRGLQGTQVTPTWFLRDRDPLVGATIRFEPRQAAFRSLADYLPAGVTLADVTGIELAYVGKLMEAAAQVTLRSGRGSEPRHSLDVPFTMGGDFKSTRLEAVWAADDATQRAVISLANVGNAPAAVRVTTAQGTTDVELRARSGQSFNLPSARWAVNGTGWMRIDHRGAPGTVRATGFLLSPSDPRPDHIRFYDPATAAQSHLFATGVNVEGERGTLAIKNTSGRPVTARLLLTHPESGDPLASVPAISLAHDASARVDLAPYLRGLADLRSIALKVESSGEAGSIIGDLQMIGSDGLLRDVPLRDSGTIRASAGAYPWRIDGDHQTRVAVTNAGTRAAVFNARLTYEGGAYIVGSQTLAPGATAIFDIRRLRDAGEPDAFGHRLPERVESGQFHWSTRDPDPSARFLGRAEITSVAEHTSSSYSCGVCCPDSYVTGYASVSQLTLNAGDSDEVEITELLEDCYNDRYEQPVSPSSLSYNTDVIDVDNLGGGALSVEGRDDGSTTVQAGWSAVAFYEVDEDCYFNNVSGSASFQVQARAPVLNGPSGCVVRGNSATFSIGNLSSNASVTYWRFDNSYGNVYRTTSTTASNWEGTVVVGGEARVDVTAAGREFYLSKGLCVTARSGWTTSPASPSAQSFYSFTVPPASDNDWLGLSQMTLSTPFSVTQIGDQGPSHGLKYTDSTTFSTTFRYQISPALDSSNEFYQKQCGTWRLDRLHFW